MPPDSRENTPTGRRQYCGLGNHYLKTPNRALTDRNMLYFARKINPEVREGTLLCLECFQMLQKIFRLKVGNARKLKKQAESISDASSSQQLYALASSSDPSSATSTVTPRRNPTPTGGTASNDNRPATSAAAAAKRKRASKQNDSDERAPKRTAPPSTSPDSSQPVSDDDDPNSNLSLNAVNGTRLPHIQPIPRRRQTVHLNKQAMDIYLAGTTGG
ncbi:hypothetical protein KR009_001121 [Drosophila setifemur]|nr:hypothetical protein KR009_001121 [Drosophila setifemur]